MTLIAPGARAAQPVLKWVYAAQTNLYSPPLVADMHPTPGLETVISDSDVRTLRCVDAQGNLLWEYRGNWTKRLTSGASLSFTARPGKGTLVVGNADGKLCCVDAATGRELWTQQVGSLEWGTAIWADLDGDGTDEIGAGTDNSGIVALRADGSPLWNYEPDAPGSLYIQCPIGAVDIDGDSKAEIFAVERSGPFCLNADGTLRWHRQTGDFFQCAPIVTDLEGDGHPELIAVSRESDAVHCLDAVTGEVRWKCGMVGPTEVYPGSSVAVGDLDGDGVAEVIASDNFGHVHCIGQGRILWLFTTDKATHGAVSLGDVDGDQDVEVLVASGDHTLYCLDSSGRLEWRFEANLRLIHPATIADVDADGKTDILFCGSDHLLRCLTLGGRYVPDLIPWPSRRFDPAQTGSNFVKAASVHVPDVIETASLLTNGGFEMARAVNNPQDYPEDSPLFDALKQAPRNWRVESGGDTTLRLSREHPHSGTACAAVPPASQETVFATEPIPVERALRHVSASILVHSDTPQRMGAKLKWVGAAGVLREDPLTPSNAPDDPDWTTLVLDETAPPWGAQWLSLVCVSPAHNAPIFWDDAALTGSFARRPVVQAAVNQVGYETGAPKQFTAWSNFMPGNGAAFELVNADNRTVFEGTLVPQGRITGAYGNDWGFYYWRGDFSSFDEAGDYRLRVSIDGTTTQSWPFTIGENVLWDRTSRPAYRFFYYQRCGTAVPGFHGPCHLDDAVSPDGTRQYSLSGGWHDAGDYNTYNNAPYVIGLAHAYEREQAAFDVQDEDGNGRSDFLDEILWGGDLVRRMIADDGSAHGDITSGYGFWGPPELETDNMPNTGDERRIRGRESGNDSGNHVATVAKIARHIEDNAAYTKAAERAFEWRAAQGRKDALQLSAALDLYVATGNEDYARHARDIFPSVGMDNAPVIEQYDAVFGEDHRQPIHDALVARANDILQLGDNPFGVYQYGPKDHPTFFGTPAEQGGWHVGNSSHILEAANVVAMAYQYEPDPRYLEFVYDQFNWILGNNPYDLCLMEAVGSKNPPTYHHRYAMAGVPRGAVPGSVVNGITWRRFNDDRPYFDMRGLDIPDFESNEVWLPHNTNYLNALANLKRARERP